MCVSECCGRKSQIHHFFDCLLRPRAVETPAVSEEEDGRPIRFNVEIGFTRLFTVPYTHGGTHRERDKMTTAKFLGIWRETSSFARFVVCVQDKPPTHGSDDDNIQNGRL